MQNAKDTFYITLRDRLAALNPSRTIVMRGTVRPAVVVAENELATATDPAEAFVLTWPEVEVDASEPMPLHTLLCDIAYLTRGTARTLAWTEAACWTRWTASCARYCSPRLP